MDWQNDPYSMICGSSEAECRVYKKLTGRSGKVWLVAVQDNPADNVYVSGGKGSQGFAGRTLEFELEDGSVERLVGPWHTNSGALFADTGYDVRDKHLTFGVIGLGREYKNGSGGGVTITDVIYQDEDWTIGTSDRIEKIAQKLANELGKTVMKFSKSSGGSSCGQVKPEKVREIINLSLEEIKNGK